MRKTKRSMRYSIKTVAVAVVLFSFAFNATLIPFLTGGLGGTGSIPTNPVKSDFFQALIKPNTTFLEKPIRLQVPFYVYQEGNLNWENLTTIPRDQPNYSSLKHSDDYWLYQAALRHPMRTLDPESAKLFFVPFFLNAVNERKTCIPFNGTSERCFKRPGHAYRYADEQLASSPYFQRSHGADHVVVISHWLRPLNKNINHLLNCNIINFEGRIPLPLEGGLHLPSFYVGRGCDRRQRRTHDFVLVATFRPLLEFQDRENICQWLRDGKYSVSRCGQGDQCPALAQATFGFHARGDTLGSNRVMDLLLSRTVPIFTHPEQYNILPDFVPWKEMSYLVNVSTRESFDREVSRLLSIPKKELEEKLQLIDDYLFMFDHRQIYQFDAYMDEFAKLRNLQ